MIFGLFLLVVIILFWQLFIKGFLFKSILFVFGWFGIYMFLWFKVPESHALALGSGYSWAGVVPTAICVLTLLTTKE